MVIPKWLSRYATSEDILEINAAIEKAEETTTAEIVPVVVKNSSTYLQTHTTINLMVIAVVGMVACLKLDWVAHWGQTQIWFEVAEYMVIGFLLVLFLRSSSYMVRWLTPKAVLDEMVMKRAQVEFYENCIHQTKLQEGVLIFISIFERKVVVLGDARVSKEFAQEDWQDLVAGVAAELKRENLKAAIDFGLKSCSEKLSGAFPLTDEDLDELKNEVVIKE